MQLRIIAVGTRMPAWIEQGCDQYRKRLPAFLALSFVEVPYGKRGRAQSASHAVEAEGEQLLSRLGRDDYAVALDEHGRERNTRELSQWLEKRMQRGRDLCFLIGGPDGLAQQVLARADERLALSRMTLPHALVRVLLAEQLYRAYTLLAGHPYHRG
jgi:23S rRNA (pseudouridine1915-N3)-methyltransferase